MKKTKKTKSTHANFWRLIKNVPGYTEQYKDVIKEGIVGQYSKGKTCSLSEMYQKYPAEYSLMIEGMKGNTYAKWEAYDVARDQTAKRVLAAICTWLDKLNYVFASGSEKIQYAKSVACRAANCPVFNKIPLSRMDAIYNLYCNKNKVDVNDNPALNYIITKN